MILEGVPRLHPSKTLTTRTIIDLSLPRVIERTDAPILNLSPKEQTRVHNLINDPRTADDRVFGIRKSKTRASYISNTMVGKGASRGSVGHAAVLLDRIRANARISLQAKAAPKKRDPETAGFIRTLQRFFSPGRRSVMALSTQRLCQPAAPPSEP